MKSTLRLLRLLQIMLLLLTFLPVLPVQAQLAAETTTVATPTQPLPATGALTAPATGDPLTIAMNYLHANYATLGLTADDLSDLVVKDRYVTAHNGVTHLYLRQRLDSIEVFNGDININVTRDGRILNLGNRFVRDLRHRVNTTQPTLPAVTAVQHVAQRLNLAVTEPFVVTANARSTNQAQEISGGGLTIAPIPAQLIYQPVGAEVRLAWNFVLRLQARPDWLNVRADAVSGELLSTVNWTTYHARSSAPRHQVAAAPPIVSSATVQGADPNSYLVYALPTKSPDDGDRTLLTNPADPVASPFGWHDVDGMAGADYTTTRGNNSFSYADRYEPDGFSEGDVTVDAGPGLAFIYPITFTQPATTYVDAALTNLFYVTNWMHDVTYHYGFDEASGNFQSNNYGRGGLAEDAINAEAHNAFGISNANFAAPPDGIPGRMQMYVGSATGKLTINSPTPLAGDYLVGSADFGPASFSLTGDLVRIDDGDAGNDTSVTDGCQEPFSNASAVNGKVALIDRGNCSFRTKVRNAQNSGAIGVVIINNSPAPPSKMGDDPTVPEAITIPALMVSQADGAAMLAQLALSQTVNATLFRDEFGNDGAFDNQTIAHEYGHGISTRLTGGPSNSDCLFTLESAGMGEGWSDFLELVFTARAGDTGAMPQTSGNWLDDLPPTGPGVRHFPYSTDLAINPQTFASTFGMEVTHDIGEVWASLLWEMYWQLVEVQGFDGDLIHGDAGNQRALQLVIDGMKLQPCNPTFVEARDAILTANQVNHEGADQCRLWAAFAKRGLGYQAAAGNSEVVNDGVESFALPPSCTLAITPLLADLCQPQAAQFAVALGPSIQGATTLSVTNAPTGTTVAIIPNPVTPPAQSTITVGNTTAAAPGLYRLEISGTDSTANYRTAVELALATAPPAAPQLLAPASAAMDISAEPTFTWAATPQATYYALEVSTEPTFATLVYTATVRTTTVQIPFALRSDQHYHWRVTARNGCGLAPIATADFTVRRFPRVLLIDDDEWGAGELFNNTPFFTETLTALQIPYAIWDTGDGSAEPQRLDDLINYTAIIWNGGILSRGLAPESEAVLGAFLEAGKCLFMNGQNYHTLNGLTPFMQDYLGVATVQDDQNNGESWHTVITGTAPIFTNVGPYSITYPVPGYNYSDIIIPDATAQVALMGNGGGAAAIYKDGGHYRTVYWGVDFGMLPTLAARQATLARLLTWCDAQISLGSGTTYLPIIHR